MNHKPTPNPGQRQVGPTRTRDERRELVAALSAEGMSTRAIAPIVGASQRQVARDMSVEPNDSPAPATPVQGVDGKSYVRPERNVWVEPGPPSRVPVAEAAKAKRRTHVCAHVAKRCLSSGVMLEPVDFRSSAFAQDRSAVRHV